MNTVEVKTADIVRQLQSIIDQLEAGLSMTGADKAMAAQFAINVMIAGLSEDHQK